MADKPIKFPEKRSQISRMVDLIGEELKNMKGYRNVGPDQSRLIEIFGGRKIPRKFTFAQMRELIKDMSPLADTENNAFTLSQLIEEKYPGTIDKKDFDRVDKEIGTTMDLQAKGNLIEPPANDPKSMAKLNPETATAREVAELYATEQKLKVGAKAYGNTVAKYLGDVADQPGSAISIFTPDETGETLLSKTFKSLDLEVDSPKQSMQALRQVGLRIARELPANSNILAFLPEEKPDTPKNVKIFGIKEPPKPVSEVSIKTDKATMQNFFRQVTEIAKDPKQEAAAMAVLFNMQNGLRPNAVAQLKVSSYYPDTRAIYISAETTGAKGRRVNVPLNDIGDAILQARLQDGKTSGGYFFVKPNGKPVESGDMTKILKQVKIPGLIFDSGTGKTFDSLAPEGKAGEVPGKRGASLLRNLHTKVAQRSGVSFERIAYLQGRSLKAAAEGTTGEVTGYAQDYPGDLDPKGPDARNANIVSTYFAEAASEAGYEVSEAVPPPSQRVGRATPGYESFFEAPVETAKMPAPAAPVESAAPSSYADFTEEDREALRKAGFKIDFSKIDKGKASIATLIGTGIASAEDAAAAAREFIGESGRDLAIEGALLAAKAPTAIASAATLALDPDLGVGISPSTLRPEDRMAAEAMKDSAMRLKPEAGRDFIPAPEVEEDNFLTMQP